MSSYTSQQIEVCRNNLQTHFKRIFEKNASIAKLAQSIHGLIQQLKQNCDTTYFTAEQNAAKVHRLRNEMFTIIESNYTLAVPIDFNCPTPPLIWKIVSEITTLQRLYCQQFQFEQRNENTVKSLQISEIQNYLQNVLNDLEALLQTLSSVISVLKEFILGCNGIQFPPDCTSLNNFSTTEALHEESVQNVLYGVRLTVIERLTLMFDKQPVSAISTTKKTGIKQREDATIPSQTNLSLQLLNIFGCMAKANQLNPVTINISLLPEEEAKKIMQNGCWYQPEPKTKAKIYSPDSDIIGFIEENRIHSFFQTSVEANNIKAEVPAILIRQKEKENNNVRAAQEKYYFYITADLQIPTSDPTQSVYVKAWTLSASVCVSTHSSQKDLVLASGSWARYFSDCSGILPQPRTNASIYEVLEILQLHFKEWTNGLNLDNSQLQFFATWLLEDLHRSQNGVENQIPLENIYNNNLTGQNFSFWSWFVSAVALLRKPYIRELFQKGYFKAFVTKEAAYQLLSGLNGERRRGDFILRFSQTIRSTITAVFVTPNLQFASALLNLDFASDQKLRQSFITSLYEKLKSGDDAFLQLYPNIKKEDAFPTNGITLPVRPAGYVAITSSYDC